MVSNSHTRFIKYVLIIILAIGLYFTWLQRDKFEAKIKKLQTKIDKLHNQTKKLKQKLQSVKQVKKIKVDKNQSIKTIKIVLPNNKIDYSKVIPKVDYNLNLNKMNLDTKQSEKVKILPSITLDKQTHKIDKIEVNIKTKF